MSKHSSHSDGPAERRDYSDRDIQLKPIIVFSVYIALFTALVFGAVRYAMSYWERQARTADARLSPMAVERQLPAAPLLQIDEPRDLAAQRVWESSLLTNYAVVDKDAGVVRIPVERAMELIAQRGLPARTSAP